MQDGVVENFTAGLLGRYLDGCGAETGNRGLSFVDPVALAGHVTELDRLGFQVHFHALGDRAVRECLDAVAAARSATAGPAAGTTSPTCRWSTRPTSRGSPSSARPRRSSRCGRRTSRRWTT